MSSRGSKSKNGHVTTTEYKKEGNLVGGDGKILVGKNNKFHSLPDYSHSPNAKYIKLEKDGSLKEIRIYNEEGFPILEIGNHTEKCITGNRNEKVLHTHEFTEKLDRINWKLLKKDDELYKKYEKYLKEFGL